MPPISLLPPASVLGIAVGDVGLAPRDDADIVTAFMKNMFEEMS
jgi:hypothetical protein